MYEYIVKYKSVKFLINVNSVKELVEKICNKLNNDKKFVNKVYTEENIKISQHHAKFDEFFDIDYNALPREGVLNVEDTSSNL